MIHLAFRVYEVFVEKYISIYDFSTQKNESETVQSS